MLVNEIDFDLIKTLDVVKLYENETGFAVKRNAGNVCPFCDSGNHRNHTGAFALYPKTQSFFCFACQRSGSVLDFISILKQCDTKTAAEYINKEYFNGHAMRERDTATNKTTANGSAVATFKEKQLNEQPTANGSAVANDCKLDKEINAAIFEIVRNVGDDVNLCNYLDNRGFTADIRARWNIATFSASSYKTINEQLKQRFSVEKLRTAGVLSAKDNFLFYNHRILLFNRNNRGEFLNIKARAVPTDETKHGAKYLNQHGEKFPFCTSAIYTARRGDNILIVEGEFDAIAANELGVAAVSVGGVGDNAEIYRGLLELIARRGLVAVPCFDNDDGGQRAEKKLITTAANVPNLQIIPGRVPSVDGCKDFADILKIENVTKREIWDKLEKYTTTAATLRISEIAQNENISILETRRGFMEFIKYFSMQNICFSDNYEIVTIN